MSEPINLPYSCQSLQGSNCLVTGAAGFIGSHLVDALIEQGSEVRALDNLSTGFKKNLAHLDGHAQFTFVDGDAADPATTAEAVKGCDAIFHLAAMASVPRSMREPALCHAWCATSTVNLLDAANQAGVRRMVLASTSAAYGDSTFVSKRETDPPAPLSPYAAAKLSAENYLRSFAKTSDLETVILRFFNVFGPRQDPQSEYSAVIPRFVSLILASQPPVIYGDGLQSRDFVYVQDVAKANLLAATVPGISGEVFNVARGQRTTLLELIAILSDLLEKPITPIHEPARLGDVRDSLADVSHSRTSLLFEPDVDMVDGLRRSIDYYRSIV